MSVIAIDPGPERSAWLVWDGKRPVELCQYDTLIVKGKKTDVPPLNSNVLRDLYFRDSFFASLPRGTELAIESISAMGQRAGSEVFETAYWVGRFVQAWAPRPFTRITRREVKMFLTGTMRSKDADVRHAIISRFGGKEKAVGLIKNPGPLYGVVTHLWSALAVALTWEENQKTAKKVLTNPTPPE